MPTKHDNPCFENAADDEPIFVLRAQDRFAPSVVRYWAGRLAGERGHDDPKVAGAYYVAEAMEAWAKANGSKIPD